MSIPNNDIRRLFIKKKDIKKFSKLFYKAKELEKQGTINEIMEGGYLKDQREFYEQASTLYEQVIEMGNYLKDEFIFDKIKKRNNILRKIESAEESLEYLTICLEEPKIIETYTPTERKLEDMDYDTFSCALSK